MIIFKNIRYKNILSTGNVFTEIDLNKNKTTLIVGENGAGKSTILDALAFVLFGKTFRSINKSQLINSITRKEALVEIEFSIPPHDYFIRRGMKPNVFEVYCGDKLLNQSADIRDYQEILEKQILKINYKSFCQVVVLGSASFVPFMQLPAGQRRAIIEDLLDLQVFTVMNTLLKDDIQTNSSNIQAVEHDRQMIDQKIKMTKEHLKELQSKNDEFINEKKALISNYKKEIEEELARKVAICEEMNKLTEKTKDENTLKSKLSKLTNMRAQLEAKIGSLDRDIQFFTHNEDCPTCKQSIDTSFKCDIIDSKSNEAEEVKSGLQKLMDAYDNTSKQLEEVLEISNKYYELTSTLMMIDLQLKNLEHNVSIAEQEIERSKKTAKETNSDKVVDLDNQLIQLGNKYNELQDDKMIFQACATMLKDGGIKTKIINQYIPVINKLINKYLSSMDFFVDFQLNGQFEETIKSRYRDEFTYASFSEGEKFRINLALLFAWRAVAKMRNSAATNLLILDEVMDSSLDVSGTEEFMKIINTLAGDTNTFIISHRTEQITEKFDNVIRFLKNKNFSRVAA